MQVGQYDIEVRKGSTFRLFLTYRDSAASLVNLTGYTAKFQIKATKSLAAVAALSLTSGSGITLGGVNGTIQVIGTDEQTATLTAGIFYYDLLLIDGSGAADALIEGRAVISEGVSS